MRKDFGISRNGAEQMNYSMVTADRVTHFKIIIVALLWASVLMAVAASQLAK